MPRPELIKTHQKVLEYNRVNNLRRWQETKISLNKFKLFDDLDIEDE